MITIHNVAQGSEEWHKLRDGVVTASNASKLLTGGIDAALAKSDFQGNKYTRRGQELEPLAIEAYEAYNMIDTLRCGFVTNSKYPGCGASPDAITDRNIQVKCYGTDKHLSINRKYIPFDLMAQIQFEMMIYELPLTDIVLFNPDVEPQHILRIIEVKADNKIFKRFKDLLYGRTHSQAKQTIS